MVDVKSGSTETHVSDITREQEAIEDLRKLQKDGLQVVWPRSQKQQEREHRLHATTATTNSENSEDAVSSSLQEALKDLDDLQKDGLSVVWPRGMG